MYLIHRRDSFRGFEVLAKKVKNTEKITLVLDSVVTEISGDERVSSVSVKNVKTNELSDISVSACFVAIGMEANTKLLDGKIKLTASGHIDAGENTVTNLAGVFAAGDIRKKISYQIVTAVADGAVAAHMAGIFITERG